MRVVILFIHHKICSVTVKHHEMMIENNGDNDTDVVPLTYPEHRNEALPGSYVASNMSGMRKNHIPSLMKVRGFTPYDLDCLVWDYVLFSGQVYDKIIITEWDTRCTQNVREFYGSSLLLPLVGSRVRRGKDLSGWPWAEPGGISESLLAEMHMLQSLTPTCGIAMDWSLAARNAELMMRDPFFFDDMHSELAIGTLSYMNGISAEPSGKLPMIDCRRVKVKDEDVGVFHPVKTEFVAVRMKPRASAHLLLGLENCGKNVKCDEKCQMTGPLLSTDLQKTSN